MTPDRKVGGLLFYIIMRLMFKNAFRKIFKFIKIHWRAGVLSLFLCANFFIWYSVFAESRNGKLTIAFLDVGQGDSIFIDSPTGNQVLIDGGPNKKVLRELRKVMPFYDRSIDLVIATHPDADHITGLIDIVRRFDINAYMDPGIPNDTSNWQSLISTLSERKIENILVARRGMRVVLGSGAYMDILFPDRDMTGADTNDASVVARLVYGDSEFMLTGDSPQKIEEYLTQLNGKNLKSDILKLGHHGSKTSSSAVFLSVVGPEIGIISAGENNRYGHPHKEVLDLLSKQKIKALSTAEDGTIIFKTNGDTISRE